MPLTIEDPSPAGLLYKCTANERPQACADGEDDGDKPEILGAFAKRHHIADDEINQHVDTASADTLDGPARNEHGTVASATSDTTTEHKKCDGRYSNPSTPKEIGKLAIDGLRGGACQQECVHNPRVVVAKAEFGADGACGIGHNCIGRSVQRVPLSGGARFRLTSSFKSG
jgi:hypothetical protein